MLGLLAGGVALVAVLGLVLQRSVDAEVDPTATDVAAAGRRRLAAAAGAGGRPATRCRSSTPRAGCGRASADADRLVPMLHARRAGRGRGGRAAVHRTVRPAAHRQRTAARGRRRRRAARRPATRSWSARSRWTCCGARTCCAPCCSSSSRCWCWPSALRGVAGHRGRRCARSRRCGAGPRRSPAPAVAGRLPVPPAHDEIHRLAVTLNGMLDRLEAAAPGSGSSSPTPRTSCAARWRTCGPSWRWRGTSARPPTGRPSAEDVLDRHHPAVAARRRPAAARPGRRDARRGSGRRAGRPDRAGPATVGRRAAGRGRSDAGAPCGRSGRPTSCAGWWPTCVDNAVRHARTRVDARRAAPTAAEAPAHGDRRRAGHPGRGPGAGLRAVHPARRRRAPATTAAPGSAWPSCGSWCAATAARSPSTTPRPATESPGLRAQVRLAGRRRGRRQRPGHLTCAADSGVVRTGR